MKNMPRLKAYYSLSFVKLSFLVASVTLGELFRSSLHILRMKVQNNSATLAKQTSWQM